MRNQIIIHNRIKCKRCGDVIESMHCHDFVTCKCGACSADGGREYLRRAYNGEKPEDVFEEMSEVTYGNE